MLYVLWRKRVLDFLVIGHERSSDDVEHAVGVIHAGKVADRMNIILGNKGMYDTVVKGYTRRVDVKNEVLYVNGICQVLRYTVILHIMSPIWWT